MKKSTFLTLLLVVTFIRDNYSQVTCTLNISFTPPTGTATCDGSATVTSIAPGSASLCPVSCTWIPTGHTTTTINGLCPGYYTVNVNYGGGPGCCGLTSGTVTIPNGPTGISKSQISEPLFSFDNSTGLLNIKHINKSNLSLKVIDISGKAVKYIYIDDNSRLIDLSVLDIGIYIINLYSDNEIIYRQKINLN